MKKLLSCFLCVVMILTTFSLTSCGGDKKVDTINGVDPEEALANALEMIENADRYSTSYDLNISLGVGFLSVKGSGRGLYTETHDGDNYHYLINEDAGEASLLGDIWDELTSAAIRTDFDELWYYDGMYYIRDGSSKKKYSPGYISISLMSGTEMLYDFFDLVSDYNCYVDYLGQYYIQGELSGDSEYIVAVGDISLAKLTATVYFNKDGSIKRLVIGSDTLLAKGTSSFNYKYNNAVPELTLPADISSYESGVYNGYPW